TASSPPTVLRQPYRQPLGGSRLLLLWLRPTSRSGTTNCRPRIPSRSPPCTQIRLPAANSPSFPLLFPTTSVTSQTLRGTL
ncbi:MAG: hypothetical protein ACK55Z_31355, partial [bacterium]